MHRAIEGGNSSVHDHGLGSGILDQQIVPVQQ